MFDYIFFSAILTFVYFLFGVMIGYILVHESGKFESLSDDAQGVLVLGAALVWPIALLGCLGWLLRRAPRFLLSRVCGLGRGVRDLKRAVLPAGPPKVRLPRATIERDGYRRDGEHVMVGTASPLAENFAPSGHEHGCGVAGCTESSCRRGVEPLGW